MKLQYDQYRYKAELERRVFARLAQETCPDEGTFLQAMVLSEGNEALAKAKYYELRFRQLEESGGLEQDMLEILSEKGELCHICKKERIRSECIVKLPTLSSVHWAHSRCMAALRARDFDSALALAPDYSRYCMICYGSSPDYDTAIYKGLFVRTCGWHFPGGNRTVVGEKTCSVCGETYSIFKKNRQKCYKYLLTDNGLVRFYAHKECESGLVEKLKAMSI